MNDVWTNYVQFVLIEKSYYCELLKNDVTFSVILQYLIKIWDRRRQTRGTRSFFWRSSTSISWCETWSKVDLASCYELTKWLYNRLPSFSDTTARLTGDISYLVIEKCFAHALMQRACQYSVIVDSVILKGKLRIQDIYPYNLHMAVKTGGALIYTGVDPARFF